MFRDIEAWQGTNHPETHAKSIPNVEIEERSTWNSIDRKRVPTGRQPCPYPHTQCSTSCQPTSVCRQAACTTRPMARPATPWGHFETVSRSTRTSAEKHRLNAAEWLANSLVRRKENRTVRRHVRVASHVLPDLALARSGISIRDVTERFQSSPPASCS